MRWQSVIRCWESSEIDTRFSNIREELVVICMGPEGDRRQASPAPLASLDSQLLLLRMLRRLRSLILSLPPLPIAVA